MEAPAFVLADCKTDRQMIRNGNLHVPSDIVEIFFVLMIDDPGGHDATIIKCARPSEGQHGPVMNVEHVLRPCCFNFDIGRLRTTVSVSRAKVSSQHS